MLFNSTFIANEKYINEASLDVQCDVNTQEKPCKVTPEFRGYLITELPRLYVIFKSSDVSRKKVYYNYALNVCSIARQPGLNLFTRLLFEQLKESVNHSFECPLKKVRSFI